MFKLKMYKIFILACCMLGFSLLLVINTEFNIEKKLKASVAVRINNFLNYHDSRLKPHIDKKQNTASVMINQSIVFNRKLIAMTSKLNYSANEDVEVLIKSMYPGDITITQVGLDRKQIKQFKFAGSDDFKATVFNTMSGFNKQDFTSYKFKLQDKENGWIQISVKTKDETQNIPIFVNALEKNDILFVESTDTMKAYVSAYGAKTHYRPRNPSIKGAFTRPNQYPVDYQLRAINDSFDINCHEHLANADIILKNALIKKNITFDNAGDDLLNKFDEIKKYKVIVFGAHNEYWSVRKILNIQKYIDNGGKVLILGGNTAWRFIENTEHYDVTFGDGFYGSYYEDFIYKYLGAYYSHLGYLTSAPFQANKNIHKHLTNYVIEKDGLFGKSSDIPNCKKIKGASGHETDKLATEAVGFVTLATGTNEKGAGAAIVYKRFDSGGEVLNFGSVGLWHKINDPTIINLITTFVNSPK